MDSLRSLLVFSAVVTLSQSYKMCLPLSKAVDPTLEYFNLYDAYNITWMHAANSMSKVNEALASSLNMVEADVLMRHNRSDTTPIMAHPPDTDSNLTLAQFLEKVTASNKGMKLDFKSLIAVEPSLKLLKNISDSNAIRNPVWLNADILDGPCFDKVSLPINPKTFIELCQQYFPNAVLSLGWTTGNEVKDAKNKYTWGNVIEMGQHVSSISQPVTFPVRAALIKRSLPQLLWLLDLSRNLTLTVWSSESDDYDTRDLLELRFKVYDKKNVYYDLPEKQAEDLKHHLRGPQEDPNNPYHNNLVKLKGYSTASCTDVLVGETKVMFTGKGGWVSSVEELQAKNLESQHITIGVSFISLDGQNATQNVTVIVGSSGLSGANADLPDKEGLKVILQNTGEFQVITPEGKIMKSSGRVPDPNSRYWISIFYGQGLRYVNVAVSSAADINEEKRLRYEGGFKPSKMFMVIGVGEKKGCAVILDKVISAIALPSSSSAWILPFNFVIITLIALVSGIVS
ncbi:protein FAM151A-like [Actinia tenebrosa]|uniref:Protein FAM151A-like n=1 Tax=Actinia tenebrosa TaxID=6105 RepID=A0A6P8HDZ8_ACTTE|nr:protein FAM151A-like [Actinia tenebrosa]